MGWQWNIRDLARNSGICAVCYATLGLVLLLLTNTSQAISEKSRFRTFSQKEIEIMKTKTAVISTKFGDITMKLELEAD